MTREELEQLIWNALMDLDSDASRNYLARTAVNALIAAGWRYVGPDQVVIKNQMIVLEDQSNSVHGDWETPEHPDWF